MTDSGDHVSGKTSLTLTITASKDGAAFASITPTVTERGNGWYNLALTTSHTDTLGDLALNITATGADPTDLVAQVIAFLATVAVNLDAAVSSRSDPATAQSISSNADITAIKGKTDNLPSDPADQSLVIAATDALASAISGIPAAAGARAVATGLTQDTALHLAAALAGSKLLDMVAGEAGTSRLRKYDDSGDLAVAVQDADGNRTSVTVTP